MATSTDTSLSQDSFPPEATMVSMLERLEHRLLDNMQLLIKPLSDKLNYIRASLAKTEHTAEGAVKISKQHPEDFSSLTEENDSLHHWVLLLEMTARQSNLKFRGFEEKLTINTDFSAFLAGWFKKELALENAMAPLISKIYCLGSP